MTNATHEARANVRVKTNNYVSWRVEDSHRAGEGRVLNISTTGMLIETTSEVAPFQNDLFSFVSGLGAENFIPSSGQLVWCKKKKFGNNSYLCGIKFVQISENILSRLQQKIQDGMTFVIKSRQSEKVTGVLVGAAFCLLAGYVMWLSSIIYQGMQSSNDSLLESNQQQAILTQTYSNLYHVTDEKLKSVTAELEVTKKLYDESQIQLASVTKELETTRNILSETESMLSQTKSNNSQLKNEVVAIKDTSEQQIAEIKAALEKTVQTLEENNIQLTLEVTTLRDKLNYLTGDIKSVEEGKSLLALYSNRAKVVKTKIHAYQKEAEKVRIQAMKERDRIRASIGNNGYIWRNGQAVKVDQAKYESAGSDVQKSVTAPAPRKIQIDVDFVN